MSTLLIANRGEIALRIMRTAQRMGYRCAAVFSEADRNAPHVAAADIAFPLGGNTPQESYLVVDKVIDAALRVGADCVHPGYGFLSENADFARACTTAGLTFIGPTADVIELMGNKRRAKEFAVQAGVPCIPGFQGTASDQQLAQKAAAIGYPLMLKAAAGGGGRGMRIVSRAEEFSSLLRSARAEALAAFGNDEIILEKALGGARHIEIQIFADRHGNCIHLGERDCSIQRRHQKVVEEAPSPAVNAVLREQMGAAAVSLAKACGYTGAGTVEFLLDAKENFYFLEMNTRLQVEHGVTEMVTGTDLVAWQLDIARGLPLPMSQSEIGFGGHAIEVRLYAEDPDQEFLPQSGKILQWRPSAEENNSDSRSSHVRFDHALAEGQEISPYYDPMLGKLMAWGETRALARQRLARALTELALLGPLNNRFFLQQILQDAVFAAGAAHTGFLSQQFTLPAITQTVQDQALALATALHHHLSIPEAETAAGRANWCGHGAQFPRTYYINDGMRSVPVKLCADSGHQYRLALPTADEVAVELPGITSNTRSACHTAVTLDGIEQSVQWHLDHRRLTLIIHGKQWRFEDSTYAPAQSAQAQGDGCIRAPMEGNLSQVYVRVGDSVARGDLLATMEAMKMEHALKADCDGRVSAIDAGAGSQVKSGQLLIQITAAQTVENAVTG